jgi:hypothetical protein
MGLSGLSVCPCWNRSLSRMVDNPCYASPMRLYEYIIEVREADVARQASQGKLRSGCHIFFLNLVSFFLMLV